MSVHELLEELQALEQDGYGNLEVKFNDNELGLVPINQIIPNQERDKTYLHEPDRSDDCITLLYELD